MEIEARVRVDSLDHIKLELVKLGAMFSHKETQDDVIYKRKEDLNAVQRAGSFILRIRKTDINSKLTFKALTETAGSWVEHETKVSNPKDMKAILGKIGFVNALEVQKKREHGKLGEINICLDSIEGLGDYLELEVVSDNVQDGKSKINILLQKLDFSEDQIIHDGYVAMLFKRQGVVFDGTG